MNNIIKAVYNAVYTSQCCLIT